MKPRAYYNEFDPKVADWLRNLIREGLIAPGDVDERSIEDVEPNELRKYTQCHFFAGLGVWSYALRKAGWRDEWPVWTGSCPCQPFSQAGKGQGFADERHLWPAFFHLIEECQPVTIFGEQVAGPDGLAWIELVSNDVETVGYSIGAVPFPAASVGAPHRRERLYWVADSDLARLEGWGQPERQRALEQPAGPRGLVDSRGNRATGGFWADADWIKCSDDRWRPVEPGAQPLADGAAARVVRLRGYGNAVNAEQASAFIQAFMGEKMAKMAPRPPRMVLQTNDY